MMLNRVINFVTLPKCSYTAAQSIILKSNSNKFLGFICDTIEKCNYVFISFSYWKNSVEMEIKFRPKFEQSMDKQKNRAGI